MASLFNPNNACDLVDATDLQNGEQVHGAVSLVSPLFIENLQEQGFRAPSFSWEQVVIRHLGHSLAGLQAVVHVSATN